MFAISLVSFLVIELPPGVTCTPPSGSFFPAGITRVECGANYFRLSDGVAVRDYISFLVVVSGPDDPAPNLSNDLRQVNNYLRKGDTAKACAALDTFIADVNKEVGHKLTATEAQARFEEAASKLAAAETKIGELQSALEHSLQEAGDAACALTKPLGEAKGSALDRSI